MELRKKSGFGGAACFGSYPEVISIHNRETKVKYLKELVNDYLVRDLLSFEGEKMQE
ncbi:MAG: hypothetical protein IPN18_18550 [Ignavibacteriales bacterium]|nr:hypothetical protein [Ignavibacteriales bacterium]